MGGESGPSRRETSARTRGNPQLSQYGLLLIRNFRAYTGQPRSLHSALRFDAKLPRVHGATQKRGSGYSEIIETSARTRGNREGQVDCQCCLRNFRAYTGQPGQPVPLAVSHRKLPRVHGATIGDHDPSGLDMETSARTRGNRDHAPHHKLIGGNFRAYTGQPHAGEDRHAQYRKLPRVHGATESFSDGPKLEMETSARTRGNLSCLVTGPPW